MLCMSLSPRRTILLVQLPIPPLGPAPIRGNVPLAPAYLKLFAEQKGLGSFFDIEVLPAERANALGDRGLAAAIVERSPWMVGFTCYLWNIERVLWVAAEVKRRLPGVRVVLGGPEVTADNAWLLESDCYDHAVIGEGEQTFANLLLALIDDSVPPVPIAGLYVPPATGPRFQSSSLPAFRMPLPDLNALGSPYLAGILDPADEEMLLLETTRGCVFKCKFCYYPKSYDRQYYLAGEHILASLSLARERGAREVFLLDPTLNQRRDFKEFLRLLVQGNPDHTLSYFGELRGEGITEETAALLRQANFTEVEVGLQSIEPEAMTLMDRRNNLRAFERGVRAMMREGIRVKVDLIIGLPGDTVESVRNGLRYLHDRELCSDLQVFNLAVLPGTAFRQEAQQLGLAHQDRPPYYVLRTPTLDRADLFALMQEAQDLFDIEFDALPTPYLDFPATGDVSPRLWRIDFDRFERPLPLPAEQRAQAFTLWLRGTHLAGRREEIARAVRGLLSDNPFTTLQIVLEPGAIEDVYELTAGWLAGLFAVGQERPTYLDKFYALQPGRASGAKRLVLLLPAAFRARLGIDWVSEVGEFATIVWDGVVDEDELAGFEHVRGQASGAA
jgi:radical SAM superfamily enzyme YgiQ (UPF0313 family)